MVAEKLDAVKGENSFHVVLTAVGQGNAGPGQRLSGGGEVQDQQVGGLFGNIRE